MTGRSSKTAVRGARFWISFAALFLCMGVIFPVVIVLAVFAHGLALGQGTSPAWLFLAYPVVLGFLILVRVTDADPVPRGMLGGALLGTTVFVVALLCSAKIGPAVKRLRRRTAVTSVSSGPRTA